MRQKQFWDLLDLSRQFREVLFRKKVRNWHEKLREQKTKDIQAGPMEKHDCINCIAYEVFL
jgi:hypothetical protein